MLVRPYKWEERRVLLKDRVLYVPERLENYEEYQFPGFSEVFGNENPVNIEYCSGNGAWIVEKAKENPQINWVAVELKFDRVRKIWNKAKAANLNNLLIVYGEASLSTQLYFPKQSVQEVFINFPDPWPKRRHFKNRLIQSSFIDLLKMVMKPSGLFTFVTDDPPYSKVLIQEMQQHPEFASLYQDPFFVNELEGYGSSFFEELWRSKGMKIRYHRYRL